MPASRAIWTTTPSSFKGCSISTRPLSTCDDLTWRSRSPRSRTGLFWDRAAGGYFSTAAGETGLVLRLKEDYDGAEPSANSVAALNLLRLAQMTDRSSYREAAARTLSAFASHVRVAPIAVPQMLASLAYSTGRHRQIVLVGEKEAEDTRAMVREVHHRFLPDKIVLLVDDERSREHLAAYVPSIAAMHRIDGAATAYVCENYTCDLPTADLKKFTELLKH